MNVGVIDGRTIYHLPFVHLCGTHVWPAATFADFTVGGFKDTTTICHHPSVNRTGSCSAGRPAASLTVLSTPRVLVPMLLVV